MNINMENIIGMTATDAKYKMEEIIMKREKFKRERGNKMKELMIKKLKENELDYNESYLDFFVKENELFFEEDDLMDYVYNFLEDNTPKLYTQNLTNGHKIEMNAIKNLCSYLGIESNDIIAKYKEFNKITNIDEIGIVEYIANNEFTIIDNKIVTDNN